MGITHTKIDLNKLPDVTAAQILVASANNRLAAVAMSGDIAIDNAGATTIGADKVLGSMLPDDAVGYFETATEVEVDHADASPKDLLAADVSNDRLIMVQAIASETAAGGPDFDVGSEITDTNAAFDDIGAGVWIIDERWTGFCLLPATEKLQCTIAAAGTAGKIKFRSVVLIPKVQTAQIADLAVATGKLAANAVTSGKLDESTIKYAAVEISSAELLALFTTPKTLVATPGADKVLEFISLLLALDYNSVAYTVAGCTNLQVKYTNGAGAAVSTTQAAAGFIDVAADTLLSLDKLEATVTPVVNTPLVLTLGVADPADGDSTIHAKVAYRVHATGL